MIEDVTPSGKPRFGPGDRVLYRGVRLARVHTVAVKSHKMFGSALISAEPYTDRFWVKLERLSHIPRSLCHESTSARLG